MVALLSNVATQARLGGPNTTSLLRCALHYCVLILWGDHVVLMASSDLAFDLPLYYLSSFADDTRRCFSAARLSLLTVTPVRSELSIERSTAQVVLILRD